LDPSASAHQNNACTLDCVHVGLYTQQTPLCHVMVASFLFWGVHTSSALTVGAAVGPAVGPVGLAVTVPAARGGAVGAAVGPAVGAAAVPAVGAAVGAVVVAAAVPVLPAPAGGGGDGNTRPVAKGGGGGRLPTQSRVNLLAVTQMHGGVQVPFTHQETSWSAMLQTLSICHMCRKMMLPAAQRTS
jgi:hypothetical protein